MSDEAANESSNVRRTRRLDRASVVAAAMGMADEGGIDGLTMRKLGRSLGVEAMSFYNHVANKEDLIDAMVDEVFDMIGDPIPGEPWREAMTTRAQSTRSVLRTHPWATPLLDSRTSPGAATMRHLDATLGCLRNGGFSVPLTAHAIALLDAYVYGFSLQEAGLPFEGRDETVDLAEAIMEGLGESHPHLAELVSEHITREGYDFADEFDFGLEVVLDGLERALQPQD